MKKILTLFIFLNTIFLYAQPKIHGNLYIDMENGLIECDFKISDLPNLNNYKILLNKGMNIKYFKNNANNSMDYSGHYDGKVQGEAVEYYFIDNKDIKTNLPESFNINYKGAFPIYSNEFNIFDYKGIIAFNGKTLRASEQTKWYPVIYDEDNDKLLDNYIYNIIIKVKDKKNTSIFINGSQPQQKKNARLVSNKPFQLLLFVGDYSFIQKNGDYILNSEVTQENSKKIFNNIENIKRNLSKNLDIDFTDNIYLINHTPINKRQKGSSWGFNTYPTFAFTGLDFNELTKNQGKFSNEITKFFGHEFAHNYFGSNVMSGKLKWFWLESFAEYLSYNIAEDLCGKDFLKKVLINGLENLSGNNFIPLTDISAVEEINEEYRYILGPLMLKCFEDTFGRAKTNIVLKNLIETAKNEILTIDSWETCAIKSGISKIDFENFKKKFIQNKNFKQNIEEEIRKNYR